MKHIYHLQFIFVIILTTFLVSCKSEIKVGFMLPNMNNLRYLVEKKVFISKIESLGGKVILRSADNDEEKQNQQFEDILKEGVDIVVLDPVNRFRSAEMVRAAHKKGIKVISYDRLVANCEVDALVTFNAMEIGRQMADYALRQTPSGNYVILGGDGSDINALMIEEAIEKSLDSNIKSGRVKILFRSLVERYASDESEILTAKCLKLTNTKPDVILTASDAMAQGVINAFLKESFTGKVLLTGQNAELYACKNIVEGKQTMTVYKPVKRMASATAELAVKICKGEKLNAYCKSTIFNGSVNVPVWLFDVITVDASNLKSTVIADGYYTEKEVYSH